MSITESIFRPPPGKERINNSLDLHALSPTEVILKVRPHGIQGSELAENLTAAISSIERWPRDFGITFDFSSCPGLSRDQIESCIGRFVVKPQPVTVVYPDEHKSFTLDNFAKNGLIKLVSRADWEASPKPLAQSAEALALAKRVANLARGTLTNWKEEQEAVEWHEFISSIHQLFEPEVEPKPRPLHGPALVSVIQENPKHLLLCSMAHALRAGEEPFSKFQDELAEIKKQLDSDVTLDFSRTTSIDASTISEILSLNQTLKKLGFCLKLTGLCPRVEAKLETSKLLSSKALEAA